LLSTAAAVTQTAEQTTAATAAGRFRGATALLSAAATVTETAEQTAAAVAAVDLTAAAIAMEQTTAAAAATMTAQTGNGRALLTADEGDANHREEHRDAEHKCTIHLIPPNKTKI
jgi:hypothetical protein